VSERNKADEISKGEFCALFGISEKQLERYCQEGMPHARRRGRVFIKMPEGRVWYHKHLEAKGEKKGKPTGRTDSLDRRLAAEAETAEIELAKLRNELMTVSDFDRLVGDAFARVRARLTNLAPRIAGTVLGAKTIQEAQARIEPIVREAMEELRRGDDVPEVDEGEAAA
jgi:hypothetical protein